MRFLAPSGLRRGSARAACHIVAARLEADAKSTALARTDHSNIACRGRITHRMGAGGIDRICRWGAARKTSLVSGRAARRGKHFGKSPIEIGKSPIET